MDKLKKSITELPRLLSAVAWCLSLSWKASKLYTIIRLCCEAIAPVATIAAFFIGKYVIDLLSGARSYTNPDRTLIALLLFLLSSALLRAIIQKVSQYIETMHGEMINSRISLILMDKSLSVDLEYFDNPEYYDKLQSANQDSSAISFILWNALSSVRMIITFLSAFFILGGINIFYGLLVLVANIPASIATAKYTKMLYMLNLDQINEYRHMNYYQTVASSREYAQEIRLFNAGDLFKNKYKRIWESPFAKRRGMTRKRAVLTGFLESLPEIAAALIGVDIAFRILAGGSTVGDYSLYTGLAVQLASAITGLSFSIMQVYDNTLKIDIIKTLDKFKNHVIDCGKKKLDCVETIEFDRVCFSYKDSKIRALEGVSFVLHKDEKVALVGLNGSGKTTRIKLLLRMYDPNNGVIRINGLNIREYKLTEVRDNFSVYFQEVLNYSFSLMENLAIADEKLADAEEAANAAFNAAYCDDILHKSVKGLNASLTRRFDSDGIELSGGQHQKLALARALFRRHSALILDEPSSNMDPKAEHEIFKSLQILTDGKMTIFTSHRLSNVYLANRIIVLEQGCVVEDGTQDELLKNEQRYAELFRYQQEKYMATTV